jgi:Questin oxidase-like
MDVMDEALERLSGCAPEFGPGLSNHGPMAAEALVALDRPEAVLPFVERYRTRLEPAEDGGRPLVGEEWQAVLGDSARWGDWVATFSGLLETTSADEVVATWAPRLAPGIMAGAAHGLIRTAHALRSLRRDPSALRRRELAEALGYWAARYQELPGPPVLIGRGAVAETVAGLPHLPEEAPHERLISQQVRHLNMIVAPFEQGVAALASPPALQPALDALATAGLEVAAVNGDGPALIALVHAVTAPMALELVLPSVRAEDRATLFAYVWQATAALHVAYATERVVPDDHGPPDPPEPSGAGAAGVEGVVDAAVEGGDEHAIKLVEASRRAAGHVGGPGLLGATADLVTRLA